MAPALTGCTRRGEVLGLRWSDVDLEAATASVAQTLIVVHHDIQFGSPKIAKGSRVISLDPATLSALRDTGERKRPSGYSSGLAGVITVWSSAESTALRCIRNASRSGSSTRLGYSASPPIRLHDLRHTWASLALATGVHPKVVQERLGHANISVTLDIYSHVTAGLHSDTAEQVAGVIFGGADPVG